MTNKEYDKIKNILSEVKLVTKEQLWDIIHKINPNRKHDYMRFYIFDLVKNNIIYRLNNKYYKFNDKLKSFQYEYIQIDNMLKEKIEEKFEGIDVCVWSTSFLSRFLNLLPTINYTFVEIIQDFQKHLYDYLKKEYNVLINPTEKELELYFKGENQVVIKKLLVRAPLDKPYRHNIAINRNIGKKKFTLYKPTIEKILVDIFVESKKYDIFNDIDEIFKGTLKTYCVNFQKLFSYSKYRGVLEEMNDFILHSIKYDYKKGEFI